MSNSPILPIPLRGGPLDGHGKDDEDLLPSNNPGLDDGESNDDQDTVDEDVREANSVNENLEN